ncbi:MAG: deoxyribodipyrimidine photo-lyase [Saprospiraceae bacterium]|nr:deoxyribodipyrimidine photo-lyase [Saprospiraceae bacterium]
MDKVSFFWFRRDLRLEDNAGLFHALKGSTPVVSVFILDRNILEKLPVEDARVTFIHNQLHSLKKQLQNLGSDLLVAYGHPDEIWKKWTEEFQIEMVYTNRDYEPYAIKRDNAIKDLLDDKGIGFRTFKDHVIFEWNEVLKDDGQPYTVFTPYSKKWMSKLLTENVGLQDSFFLSSYPTEKYFSNLHSYSADAIPELESIGCKKSRIAIPSTEVPRALIRSYAETRNFPGIQGTSRLGIHYRFGTISIREKARNALSLSQTYLNELIWRDFYSQILAHFPQVDGKAFKPAYDRIEWRQDEAEFIAWCEGKTGYPIVDAGMRELNATGFMHNRVRMITASFLTKHLLIDWRWGEAYFAEKLLDFDLASNNGGWQWAAGSGTDAAPYFRIFSPDAQTQKFDKDYKYISKWVPEWKSEDYPSPIVDHKFARERCLTVYKAALSGD